MQRQDGWRFHPCDDIRLTVDRRRLGNGLLMVIRSLHVPPELLAGTVMRTNARRSLPAKMPSRVSLARSYPPDIRQRTVSVTL
jgi:hypothetical protein